MLFPNVLHFAEFSNFLDFVGVKQHEIFFLELHYSLVHRLVKFDVGVDEDGNLASNLSQVINNLLNNRDIKPLLSHSSREELNHNPELVIRNRL